LGAGDRAGAQRALRRRKYQQTLLERAEAQLEQLEQLAASVEVAQMQRDVLVGLRRGTAVLRDIQREMGGLEAVERLLSESADARAYQAEVGEMLAGNEADAAVEEELEALRAEVAGEAERAGGEGKLEHLPRVPATAPRDEREGKERIETAMLV
jgi:charged multivesicular body protein 6